MNETIEIYERLINGEVVFLEQELISEVEQYELSIGKEKVLNNLISEHIGNDVYKCLFK